MSHALIICHRYGVLPSDMAERFRQLNRILTPDNIEPAPVQSHCSAGLCLALFHSGRVSTLTKQGICLGPMFEKNSPWDQPGAVRPEGSFALFRSSSESIELLTDITGSRTIWYLQTKEYFIASSSQRAIVALTGDFQPDRLAFAWYLSSGSLGPGFSWDQRIKALPADATLTLNRPSWQLSIQETPVRFQPQASSRQESWQQMLAVLHTVFTGIDTEHCRWAVPLSGGYDSRGILMFLPERSRVEALTWGTTASLQDPEGDSAVAARVARELQVRHHFFPMDPPKDDPETLLKRYLTAGEGRVDHLGGYLDGFQTWKWLVEQGFDGTFRGDVCWPHIGENPQVPLHIRQNNSIVLLTLADYQNFPDCRELDLPEQSLPEKFLLQPGESLNDYRERLYQSFRMPYVLSALNQLKTAYLEIVNPYCAASLIRLVRQLPFDLRFDKRLFCDIIRETGPQLPFARRASIAQSNYLFASELCRGFLREELNSAFAKGLLSPVLLKLALAGIPQQNPQDLPPPRQKPLMPLRRLVRKARHLLQGEPPPQTPQMNPGQLTLRTLLISRSCQMLQQDAKAGLSLLQP